MGRNLVGSCMLLVAISLACQPVHAGDRKSPRRNQEAAIETLVARKAHTTSRRSEMVGTPAASPFETRFSASADHELIRVSDKEDRDAQAREHGKGKPLTLFRINSKFGDIAVEPVMGQVNGAQFSLGF